MGALCSALCQEVLQHRLFAPKSTLDRRAASSVYPQVAAHTHAHTSSGRAGDCCVPVSLAVQFNSCTQEIIAIGDVLPLEGPSVAIWGDPVPAPVQRLSAQSARVGTSGKFDVPVAELTSCCRWICSQTLFSCVVKFNFGVLLCHRRRSLPSCRGTPSCAALAGCGRPRVRAELQISLVSPDSFYEENGNVGPSISLSLLPFSLDNVLFFFFFWQPEILSCDLSPSLKACVGTFLKPEISPRGLHNVSANPLLLPAQ